MMQNDKTCRVDKEVGNYKAIVKLHKEVSVEIPFEVVAE